MISPLSDKLPTATPYALDSEGNLDLELNPLVDVLSEVLAYDSDEKAEIFRGGLFSEFTVCSDPGLAAYQVINYVAQVVYSSDCHPRETLIRVAYICSMLAVHYPQQP